MWTNFLTAFAVLLLFGCADSPYANMSNKEIHAKARMMPLPQRYTFYREVLDSRIPANPVVAEDIVMLGQPARLYTMAQALEGSREEFLDALPVLSAFDGPCSLAEWTALQNKSSRIAYNREDRRVITSHVSVACEVATPPG